MQNHVYPWSTKSASRFKPWTQMQSCRRRSNGLKGMISGRILSNLKTSWSFLRKSFNLFDCPPQPILTPRRWWLDSRQGGLSSKVLILDHFLISSKQLNDCFHRVPSYHCQRHLCQELVCISLCECHGHPSKIRNKIPYETLIQGSLISILIPCWDLVYWPLSVYTSTVFKSQAEKWG